MRNHIVTYAGVSREKFRDTLQAELFLVSVVDKIQEGLMHAGIF
jgi:hypothetical protein